MIDKPLPSLPFGRERFELPQEPFRLELLDLPRRAPEPLSDEGIRAAFDRPVAGPPLDQLFRPSRRVLVVVSDATRATGSARFLPVLVDRIRACGSARVSFIVASGIHRSPTHDDLAKILGPEIDGRFEVLRHDPDDDAGLIEVGRTRAGTEVRVNASLKEHDTVVITGAATFHYFAGFGGGRKALVPGLAARETITRNHLRALRHDGARHPGARVAKLDGNPVHRDMAEGAAMVAPHLLVNSVVNADGRIEALFVGHWRRAHETACRHLRNRRSVRVEPRDLLVVSAGGHPKDINLIQAHKAMEAGIRALNPGGVCILVASCSEGVGNEDFMEGIRRGSEAEMVRGLRAEFKVYAQTALSWHRKVKEFRTILVSDLEADLVRELGAEPAADLDDALRLARGHLGDRARGWVLPQGAALTVERLEAPPARP